VSPGCFFGAANVVIGEGTFVNHDCFFDGSARIEIGAGCNIGMEVMFCTSTHDIGTRERRAALPTVGRPIVVGDGCWIGARTTVLPGVTIGHGCVIAAGALVTADTGPDGVYAGSPARRIRDLPTPATAQPSPVAATG
jgi:acetyltransferase-like isoleucine patch superfamily enzyme